jgi:hypothetical protein
MQRVIENDDEIEGGVGVNGDFDNLELQQLQDNEDFNSPHLPPQPQIESENRGQRYNNEV